MFEGLKPLVDSMVSIIGIGSVIVAIITYKRGQVTKRADVLFPLLKEFDESKSMNYAKNILDDHPITIKSNAGEISWNKGDLELILRNHRIQNEGVIKMDEAIIRKSFDTLLDFFCKLEYLLENNIITSAEKKYFDYYINKAAEEDAIINYIKVYEFPLKGYLNERLSIFD